MGFRIVVSCDDCMKMIEGGDYSRFHKLMRRFVPPRVDNLILVNDKVTSWYQSHFGKGVFFPIIYDEAVFRERLEDALPRASQIAKIKEWLLYAVTEAERELGSGTGQLKLRKVYDMFVTKFPYLVKFISFEYFSSLVDEVLIKFKKMFETNNNVKQYVDSNAVEHGETV